MSLIQILPFFQPKIVQQYQNEPKPQQNQMYQIQVKCYYDKKIENIKYNNKNTYRILNISQTIEQTHEQPLILNIGTRILYMEKIVMYNQNLI